MQTVSVEIMRIPILSRYLDRPSTQEYEIAAEMYENDIFTFDIMALNSDGSCTVLTSEAIKDAGLVVFLNIVAEESYKRYFKQYVYHTGTKIYEGFKRVLD